MNEFSYFPEPQMDRMAGLVWQLAQELYVTRQRVRALEEVLVAAGTLPAGTVDRYRPDESAEGHFRSDGDAFTERLLRTVSERDDHRAPLREQFQRQLGRPETESTG
ncbi:MAG: hypothetical protein ACRDUA_09730 [Micromonosporaceae bacterium]